ncbi:MAG: hypothetical protein R3E32_20210 [Chitinophagales bacterium]
MVNTLAWLCDCHNGDYNNFPIPVGCHQTDFDNTTNPNHSH